MSAPSNHGASLEALAAYQSAETAERHALAEASQAALDRDDPAQRRWRELRVEVARALAAPAPSLRQQHYSKAYVDGQVDALRMIAARMKQMEESPS